MTQHNPVFWLRQLELDFHHSHLKSILSNTVRGRQLTQVPIEQKNPCPSILCWPLATSEPPILSLTHSVPATPASWLFLELTSLSYRRAFAPAVPSAWRALLPDSHTTVSFSCFRTPLKRLLPRGTPLASLSRWSPHHLLFRLAQHTCVILSCLFSPLLGFYPSPPWN